MILLWGSLGDGPLARVAAALDDLACRMCLVDEEDARRTELAVAEDGALRGSIPAGGRRIDLAEVTAAYLRPRDPRADALWAWADLAGVTVVNRPAAMSRCFSKAQQLPVIASSGFAVPDTLITTDPRAALEFWDRHGAVIYKSISSTRSIVSRLTADHRQRLDDIRWCPTQFQELVPGVDHRVHVVGERTFCSVIRSSADDYRAAGAAVAVESGELPEPCAQRCRMLARQLGLLFAGIDLRVTPDGRWYCFEVNPSPAFAYYERGPGNPIAAAVAALLRDAPRES